MWVNRLRAECDFSYLENFINAFVLIPRERRLEGSNAGAAIAFRLTACCEIWISDKIIYFFFNYAVNRGKVYSFYTLMSVLHIMLKCR